MNNKTTKTIVFSEIIYLLYFTVMFGARAAGLCEGMLLYNITLVIGILLFTIKVAMTEHTIFEYIVMALLLGMSALVYKNTGEKGLLLYMTMVLGMKGVSLQRIEKVGLTILGVCFPVLAFLSVTGIISDIAYPADGRLLPGQMLRRSLGYPYFNTMFTTYVVLVVLIMLVCGYQEKKQLILSSIFFFIVGVYLYIYSCSNTGMIVLTVFLVMNIVMQSMEISVIKRSRVRNSKDSHRGQSSLVRILLMSVYPLGMVISILCPLLIGGENFEILDKLLHNRFNYANYYLTHEPVTLFGTRFAQAPNDNYLIDSSFLYSFLQIGVVPCIVLTTLMMATIWKLIKENRRIELAVVVSFCVLGLSDPFFYNLSYKNIMMLFAGETLWVWLAEIEDTLIKGTEPSKFSLNKQVVKALSTKIFLLKSGRKEYYYTNCHMYKSWAAIGEFLKSIFAIKGIRKLVIMIGVSIIIFAFAYYSGCANVEGIVDTIPEWEFFRSAMSRGLWSGITVMLIVNSRQNVL
ncbi:hypothetical protein SAMN02910276_02029 [Butyrivibrio sp. Su6]|uniref:hypothetical protein n=1 Tax=Butyrivibrio sp. Su6 TaxID=1520810 RepID=UPI00089F0805|nr:hypothetical protein [Butyrivibrio sp. Su6]SEG16077.1 hypothetical protein SAMN02910276_02029 [Butyrivibrio sp. Su6]